MSELCFASLHIDWRRLECICFSWMSWAHSHSSKLKINTLIFYSEIHIVSTTKMIWLNPIQELSYAIEIPISMMLTPIILFISMLFNSWTVTVHCAHTMHISAFARTPKYRSLNSTLLGPSVAVQVSTFEHK